MSGTGTTTAPQKTETPPNAAPISGAKSAAANASGKPSSSSEGHPQTQAGNTSGMVVDNTKPTWIKVTPAPGPSETEAAQPTTEERQAPTLSQTSGSEGPGRVAAFWFILPNRPSGNK
jgi:hypothetical protein